MDRRKRNLLTVGVIGLSVLLFAILGIVQTDKSHKTVATAKDTHEVEDGLPTIGGAFELVDGNGKVLKDTDFKGKAMLIYFGYTFCPDICPMALSHMTEAMNALGGSRIVQPVFVTVDPERDTPEALKSYGQLFHKDFIMLTGTREQVDQAKKAYRVYAAKASDKPDDNDYIVDHSSLIYLMGKDGQYCGHFNHETPANEIIQRVRAYQETGK